MAEKYRIVSENGLTRVYMPNGEELRNCTAIEIRQSGSGPMLAYISIIAINPEVDVAAMVAITNV